VSLDNLTPGDVVYVLGDAGRRYAERGTMMRRTKATIVVNAGGREWVFRADGRERVRREAWSASYRLHEATDPVALKAYNASKRDEQERTLRYRIEKALPKADLAQLRSAASVLGVAP